MLAPMIWYLLSKLISVYFPNRLLLSFLVVFAFPMACKHIRYCKIYQINVCLMIQWYDPDGLFYLSDRVGCQNFVFHPRFAARFANHSEVPHSIASRYSLSSPGLTTHNDGLILVIPAVWTKKKSCTKIPTGSCFHLSFLNLYSWLFSICSCQFKT